MNIGTEGFFVANDQTLVPLIRSASRRLIVVAPAVTKAVAIAIAEKWSELGKGRVSAILDVDEEPYHIGYGEPEGLQVLLKAADSVGDALRQQKGVRIGLVVSDDQTVVFSPTPLSVEEAPGLDFLAEQAPSPNAILLGAPPDALEKQLEGEDPAVGANEVGDFTLRRVGKELEMNPPRQFEITRTERVFNAKLEFVEFELTGAALSRRKAPIPQHLLGLATESGQRAVLEAHFRLIDKASEFADEQLLQEKRRISEEYLVPIPRYGNVIRREMKPEFEKEVSDLRKKVEKFKEGAKKKLDDEIEKNRRTVVAALLPRLREAPPREWKKYGVVEKADDTRIRKLLEDDLTNAFGDTKGILDEIKLKVVFKGVTYEVLRDPEFSKLAKERLRLESLHDEHEAAPVRDDEPDAEA